MIVHILTFAVVINAIATMSSLDNTQYLFPENDNFSHVFFSRLRKSMDKNEKECAVHKIEMVHEVMERICEMCHEMRSHHYPDTRYHCRRQCFETDNFRDCLKVFSPRSPEGTVLPPVPEPTAPVAIDVNYNDGTPTGTTGLSFFY